MRYEVRQREDGFYVVDTGIIGEHILGYEQDCYGPFDDEKEAVMQCNFENRYK